MNTNIQFHCHWYVLCTYCPTLMESYIDCIVIDWFQLLFSLCVLFIVNTFFFYCRIHWISNVRQDQCANTWSAESNSLEMYIIQIFISLLISIKDALTHFRSTLLRVCKRRTNNEQHKQKPQEEIDIVTDKLIDPNKK